MFLFTRVWICLATAIWQSYFKVFGLFWFILITFFCYVEQWIFLKFILFNLMAVNSYGESHRVKFVSLKPPEAYYLLF